MKKLTLAITVTLFSLTAGFAQVDSYKAALRTMMVKGGSEETFKTAIHQMMEIYKQSMTAVPDSLWDELEVEFQKTSIEDLVDLLAPVYKNHLTEADIIKITEFYDSPVGKKYAEHTPLITQESMVAGQEWGRRIGEKFAARLKENGY
jgi:uncharacterized protein